MTISERRDFGRVPFIAGLTIVDRAAQHRCNGTSIDLSVHGMKFYAEKFFPTGSRLHIQLRLRDLAGANPPELEATVRWARIEQDGAVMGAEFDVPLGPTHEALLYERLLAQ